MKFSSLLSTLTLSLSILALPQDDGTAPSPGALVGCSPATYWCATNRAVCTSCSVYTWDSLGKAVLSANCADENDSCVVSNGNAYCDGRLMGAGIQKV